MLQLYFLHISLPNNNCPPRLYPTKTPTQPSTCLYV